MALEREHTVSSYCIPNIDVISIGRQDDHDSTVCINDALESIPGVMNVEYNGHFGWNVFLDVEVEHNNSGTWGEIELILFPFICNPALRGETYRKEKQERMRKFNATEERHGTQLPESADYSG